MFTFRTTCTSFNKIIFDGLFFLFCSPNFFVFCIFPNFVYFLHLLYLLNDILFLHTILYYSPSTYWWQRAGHWSYSVARAWSLIYIYRPIYTRDKISEMVFLLLFALRYTRRQYHVSFVSIRDRVPKYLLKPFIAF